MPEDEIDFLRMLAQTQQTVDEAGVVEIKGILNNILQMITYLHEAIQGLSTEYGDEDEDEC